MVKLATKSKCLLILIFIFSSVILFSGIYNIAVAKTIYAFDTFDLKIARYWQGLNDNDWRSWSINYYKDILDTHDNLYEAIQGAGKGGYFKSGEIKYRPLIIWFVYDNSTVSEPKIIRSSGSPKYDGFSCSVIKNTKVPPFPAERQRIFMWDGDTTEVLKYLKYSGVMPANYSLNQNITPDKISWQKI
ncbi:MAG: hypothetical protein AB1782_16950 [Cyanobacteriota bacterium]